MWLCRQIPKHKIAGMPKRRNQANKQKKKETTRNTKEILLSQQWVVPIRGIRPTRKHKQIKNKNANK
jgi:hypothetical protein